MRVTAGGFPAPDFALLAVKTGLCYLPPTAAGRASCLTYGLRREPFRMRATLSEDAGRSWSDLSCCAPGAGYHDLGYPRTVQNAAGERYLAATLWDPP